MTYLLRNSEEHVMFGTSALGSGWGNSESTVGLGSVVGLARKRHCGFGPRLGRNPPSYSVQALNQEESVMNLLDVFLIDVPLEYVFSTSSFALYVFCL
jgi:hypothetical protein